MHSIFAHARVDDLDLDASGSAKATNLRWIIWTTKQAINIKLATKVGLFYVTLTLKTLAWPAILVGCLLFFVTGSLPFRFVCSIDFMKSVKRNISRRSPCIIVGPFSNALWRSWWWQINPFRVRLTEKRLLYSTVWTERERERKV